MKPQLWKSDNGTVHRLRDGDSNTTSCGLRAHKGGAGWMWTDDEAYPCGRCRWQSGRLTLVAPGVAHFCVSCGEEVGERGHRHILPFDKGGVA